MPSQLHHRRAFAGLLLTFHIVATTGCTSWKNQSGNVATVIAPSPAPAGDSGAGESSGVPGLVTLQPVYAPTADTARRIRVTTTRGTIELRNPRVANDSLYGQEMKNGPETAFALGEITKVETHGFSAGKTTLLVVGMLAGTLAVATVMLAAACAGTYGDC